MKSDRFLVENKKSNVNDLVYSNWPNLVQGILFYFKMTHEQLGKIVGVNQSCISEWTSGKNKPLLQNKSAILSFLISKDSNIEELINLGTKVKNSLVIKGELVDKSKIKKRLETSGELLVADKEKTFINTPILFPADFNGREIKFIFYPQEIVVFYENKNNSNPTPLKLPRLIEINDTLLIGLGIYIAEGTKTKRKPKISNSEPPIVKQGVRFFEHIGLNKNLLSGWVQVHERSKCKDENKLKRYWSKASGLKINQINDVWIKPDKSKSGNTKVKDMGTFHLECNFILSRLLIDGLLSNIENIINKTPNSELPILKGISAGEGWCGIRNGVVSQIKITFKEKRWRKITLNLLSRLYVLAKERESEDDISICGFKNLKKLEELNIFEFLPEMKNRLDNGFSLLNKSQIPFRNKERIVDLLVWSESSLTARELSNLLGLSYDNTKKHLRELSKMKYVSCYKGSGPLSNKWFCRSSSPV